MDNTTASILIAGIVAVPPTILSIATYVTSRSAALAATNASTAAAAAVETATSASKDLAVKADEIHVLVNSNLTTVKTDLQLANGRIAALQKLIERLTGKTVNIDDDGGGELVLDTVKKKRTTKKKVLTK